MRVVLLTDADVFAGTERHMLDLARGLRAAGAEVTVACPSPAALEDAARREDFPVLSIPKRGLVDMQAAWTLAGRLRSGATDVVHAHNGRTALAAALAVRLAGQGRCVMTQHFWSRTMPPSRDQRRPCLISPTTGSWGRMSRIVAISEAVRAAMLARGEAPDAKILTIPNGITAPDSRLPLRTSALRLSLGVAPDAPLVVCAARLEQEKDVASLIAAMDKVRQTLPSARCLVAGQGSLRAALQAQIDAWGLAETVRLLGFRDNALALIAASDVFVLPSLAEPFGLVLLEAMALGKPVVATDAGGPREIVLDGETGLLVPPGSPDALAAALSRLLADPVQARAMGRLGQARFESCFTAERNGAGDPERLPAGSEQPGRRIPMKILLISHTCQSQRQGQPKAAELSRLGGIDLRVLTPDRWMEYGHWRGAEPPPDAGYAYQVGKVRWPWSGPGQWYLHWYPEMARTLAEFQPDIIDLWEEPWGLVSAHTVWLRRRLGLHAKIIAETEQNIAKRLPPPFETFRAYTLAQTDFLVGRSREAVAHLRDKGYNGPAAVVPNAVDTDLFRPLDRAECRRALGLSGFVAGYIGRMVEEKGLSEMVEALACCPPEVNLLFVGGGPYQAALEQQVQAAGLAGRVLFCPRALWKSCRRS